MIKVQSTGKSFWDNKVDGYCFLLKEDFDVKKIEKYYPDLKQVLEKQKFEGKLHQTCVLPTTINNRLVQLVFVGLGKLDKVWNDSLEDLRRVLGTLTKVIKKLEIKSSVLTLPKMAKVDANELLKQATIIVRMADYEFNSFKTDTKKAPNLTLSFVSQAKPSALKEGNILGDYINLSRNGLTFHLTY